MDLASLGNREGLEMKKGRERWRKKEEEKKERRRGKDMRGERLKRQKGREHCLEMAMKQRCKVGETVLFQVSVNLGLPRWCYW